MLIGYGILKSSVVGWLMKVLLDLCNQKKKTNQPRVGKWKADVTIAMEESRFIPVLRAELRPVSHGSRGRLRLSEEDLATSLQV